MALRAGYKGIKKVGSGLSLSKDGILSSTGEGPGGSTALSDLTDVSITNPSEGQILQYDATSQKWVNHINVPEHISITVDIYSAASDTVTYTDGTGQKTVTTDTDGHGTATIKCMIGDSITFTSSVAKNPSNLSNAYSKTVNVTLSTTAIYVMPDNVLYWFGYKSSDYEVCSTANGWTAYQFNAPTENTNYLDCYGQNTGGGSGIYISGIGNKTAITASSIKVICKGIISVSSTETAVYGNPSKDITALTHSKLFGNTTLSLQSENISEWGSSYIAVGGVNNRRTNLYAVWYE